MTGPAQVPCYTDLQTALKQGMIRKSEFEPYVVQGGFLNYGGLEDLGSLT